MKKIFKFLSVIMLFTLCGCGGKKDVIKSISKKLDKCNSYHLTATLDIYRNEEIYTYDVDSAYAKDDNFKVKLTNKNNNHEQIILKNDKGVYVLTPSLNKSFKFQSDWPYNNSQIYLLQPVMDDITKDKKASVKKTKEGYIITSSVNYSTEKSFKNQKVYLDKEQNIEKIEVVDDSDNVKMSLKIIEIDYKAKFDDNYFSSEEYEKEKEKQESDKKDETTYDNKEQTKKQEESNDDTNNETQSEDKVEENNSAGVAKIEEIIYPMYVPTDTYLSGQNVVNTDKGERAILTFSGESSFTIVQETFKDTDNISYVYGDPYIILDTVGALTSDSVTWISNGVEYSVMSDTMDLDEILTVAQSITVSALSK